MPMRAFRIHGENSDNFTTIKNNQLHTYIPSL